MTKVEYRKKCREMPGHIAMGNTIKAPKITLQGLLELRAEIMRLLEGTRNNITTGTGAASNT